MLPTDLMGLVEHVRPPRLDLRNAEIEVIMANQDSLRVTLPFSARILRRAPNGEISNMMMYNREYTDQVYKCVPRVQYAWYEIGKVQNPATSLGAVACENRPETWRRGLRMR